jgi:para-nitrobenzyl esterase
MTATATTGLGTIEGLQREGHQAFLGIPYGLPPAGELRFLSPRPAEAWEGTWQATSFATSAPQPDHPVAGFAASGARGEDCLYLNVYTPRADDAVRPVLFWIHGGGFTHGTGSEQLYDGGRLAERGDVVVVSIHYRLGALGYLYLGGHGGGEWGAAPNLGQLDQVLALEWVRDHVASFGGDPGNVTIFGQSAGASAVGSLMAMPAARGLFHRAILESGSGARAPLPEQASALTAAFLDELGLTSADRAKLQAASVDALLEAQQAAPRAVPGTGYRPLVDGDSLPTAPHRAVHEGRAAQVPVLIGSNRDEAKQFNAVRDRPPVSDEELLSRVTSMLPEEAAHETTRAIDVVRTSRSGRGLPAENHDMVDAMQTLSGTRLPSTRYAEAHVQHHPDTYLYLFTWESPARRGALGACHSLEMPFVFGNLDAPTQDRFAGTGPDVERLSAQMMDAWISFARTGRPTHEGIGEWPSYDRERRPTMVFGRETRVEDDPFEEERRLLEELIPVDAL